jgi:SAM-dependent methyltransferase
LALLAVLTGLDWWRSLEGDAIDDNTAGVPPYDVDRVAEIVTNKLEVREGPVLDFGCGTGRLTAAVARLRPGFDIRGVEPADAIRARFIERLVPAVVDPVIPDVWFVGAYTVTVLQHLTHGEGAVAIKSIGQRLVPGARLVAQYVEGDEHGPTSHQVNRDVVFDWCHAARLAPITHLLNDCYSEWRWIVAVKR